MPTEGFTNSKADMAKASQRIVEYCADVRAGENVIILTDDFQSPNVSRAIFNAANAARAEASLYVFPTQEKRIIGEWMKAPEPVMSAAADADCIIVCSKSHLGRDLQNLVELSSKKTRMLQASGMSEQSLIRMASVNFEELLSSSERYIELFAKAKKVETMSLSGTNLELDIAGERSQTARGTFKLKTSSFAHSGRIEFLPAGRVGTFIANCRATGQIVIDDFLGVGLCRDPIKLIVEDGRVKSVLGNDQWFVETLRSLFKLEPESNRLVEVGIGTNPRSRLIGNYEDFGFVGSLRFGFGRGVFHSDCITVAGTMKIDGEVLIKDGIQRDI